MLHGDGKNFEFSIGNPACPHSHDHPGCYITEGIQEWRPNKRSINFSTAGANTVHGKQQSM
jgi:hypothetical protein